MDERCHTVSSSICPASTDVSPLLEKKLPERLVKLFRSIGKVADELSVRAYVVGGFVRDLLLDVPNLDVDIAIEGDGIGFARAYASKIGGKVKGHKQFGTAILILPDGFKIDVATARTERYERPGALPVVEASGIEQDLYRRDFTINSMAIQINERGFGKLIDPFRGREDLRMGRIEALHPLSFVDDPTRILRAIRFEARYGFKIGGRAERLMRKAMEARMLKQVTGERIRQEIVYILKEEKPEAPVKRLDEFGILKFLNPRLAFDAEMEWLYNQAHNAITWLEGLRIPVKKWIIYLLALLLPLPRDEAMKLHKRLRLPRKVKEGIEQLKRVQAEIETSLEAKRDMSPSEIYNLLKEVSTEVLAFILAKSKDENVQQRVVLYLERLQKVRLEIGGDDLQDLGIPPGPVYGEILEEIHRAKLDGLARGRAEELNRARKLWTEKSRSKKY